MVIEEVIDIVKAEAEVEVEVDIIEREGMNIEAEVIEKRGETEMIDEIDQGVEIGEIEIGNIVDIIIKKLCLLYFIFSYFVGFKCIYYLDR